MIRCRNRIPRNEGFDSLINERIGTWLKSDSAALPLGNGQKWQELQQKTYNSENTRDIRALVDDIQDYTCRGFGIPPALLRGDVAGLSDAISWRGLQPVSSPSQG